MTGALHTDDAFNKQLKVGQGTLIGNWYEERSIREATGEGRTVPQRHIPRSGLLKDFTKVPSQTKKGDDTFGRVYGPKVDHKHEPSSYAIGAPDPLIQNIPGKVGPLERARKEEFERVAEEHVREEEEQLAKLELQRFFDTTSGSTFTKPDESEAERATYLRKSFKDELLHGPAPDRKMAMGNEGLEVPTHAHYSNIEPVTHARMALGDPSLKSAMKVSASSGVSCFGRNTQFSKPMGEFYSGMAKDEELDNMYGGLSKTRPLRTIGGNVPSHSAFTGVPSLTELKGAIHVKLSTTWGAPGYVVLRQRLFEFGDKDGFVKKGDVVGTLREQLELSVEDVAEEALDVYLGQLITTNKDSLKIGGLMASLRPSLPQKDRRSVLNTFKALDTEGTGTVALGKWLSQLGDHPLRQTIVAAFGGEDEAWVVETPLSEQVFLELISDLAPLADIAPLLLEA